MGLFDALTGGSQGGYGGLLDALMYQSQQKPQGSPFPAPPEPLNPYEQQMMDLVRQQPNGPAGGFMDGAGYRNPASAGFPSPQPAAANPPNDAGPIAIGNYQMPRMGSADLYQPQQAMLPPNAQPAQGQLPQAAPQAPQALPPAFGGGGSALGRLGNPDGLIARLTGNDSRSVAQQNLKAQYDALVPTLGPQKAMLAVMNPEAGKILIAQALEKHQYAFTKLDDGTIVRQDPRTGSVEPAYQATPKAEFGVINEQDGQKTYGWIDKNKRTAAPVPGVEPRATSIAGPDGKQIPIPEGVDRKTFVNEVSRAGAKAAAGEKTEVQAKSEKFGNKMENAEKNLKGLDSEAQSYKGRAIETAPLIGGTMATNWAQSEGYLKYRQARDNFITALLRDESGAAIGTAEFKRYEQELFPQPGEPPSVVKQKAEARRIAIEAMKKSAGPGYKSPVAAEEGTATAAPADPLGIR